jgi:ABC-type protease/lipase transport system fused ATPase/permease subunit
MSDSCHPAPVKFWFRRALHASRMMLPSLFVLVGFCLVIQAHETATLIIGASLIIGGASDL